jgi:hypothetical protein
MSIAKSLALFTAAALVAGCASAPPTMKCGSDNGLLAPGKRGAYYSKALTLLLANGMEIGSVNQAAGTVLLVPEHSRCGPKPQPTLLAEAEDVFKRLDSRKAACDPPPIVGGDACMTHEPKPTP